MKASERFYNLMKGKPIDRLPAIEWAPWWNLTVDRWRGEGLPASAQSVYDIQNYFGLDKCCQTGFGERSAATPLPPVYGHGIMKNEADYERLLPTLYPEIRLPDEYVAWLKNARRRRYAAFLHRGRVFLVSARNVRHRRPPVQLLRRGRPL